jgi:carboxypeptidase family protein
MIALFGENLYTIEGVITSSEDGSPQKNALIVLQCGCLPAAREAIADERGYYRFTGLQAGTYTVMVLKGMAAESKVVTLPVARARGR